MPATRLLEHVGFPWDWPDVGTNYISLDLNASGVRYGRVIQVEDTDPITHIGFLYNLRTGTPPSYRVGAQGVDASTGLPTGILGGGSPNSGIFTPPANSSWNNTWQWVALANAYTPATIAEVIALTVDYSSGTINGSNFSSFMNRGWGVDDVRFPFPCGVVDSGGGGGWSQQARPYLIGYKTANGAFGFPQSAVGGTAYSSDSSPDAYGSVFNLSAAALGGATQYRLKGFRFLGRTPDSTGKSLIVTVFDLTGGGAGVQASTPYTFDYDYTQFSVTGFLRILLPNPPTLSTGVKYALMLQAGATGMGGHAMSYITTPGATEAAAYPGGSSFYLGTSTDIGTITEDTGKRPIMGLIIDAVTPASQNISIQMPSA